MKALTSELRPLYNFEDRFRTESTMVRDVQVVVGFLRLGEIDTMNEKFHAEVFIEARWVDNNQPITEYDSKIHWNVRAGQLSYFGWSVRESFFLILPILAQAFR